MAQKVQVLLVCDLHDGDVEGTETVTFAGRVRALRRSGPPGRPVLRARP